jgi:hypothetical protein
VLPFGVVVAVTELGGKVKSGEPVAGTAALWGGSPLLDGFSVPGAPSGTVICVGSVGPETDASLPTSSVAKSAIVCVFEAARVMMAAPAWPSAFTILAARTPIVLPLVGTSNRASSGPNLTRAGELSKMVAIFRFLNGFRELDGRKVRWQEGSAGSSPAESFAESPGNY